MKLKSSLPLISVVCLILFSSSAYCGTSCQYFSASIKVGKPFTKVRSPVKAVTFSWAGVSVTINGNGKLVSKSIPSVNYYYDKTNKRYRSVFCNGHYVRFTYTKSTNRAVNGNIKSIARSSSNIIRFRYNKYGYLSSISYRSNVMRFFYNNNGTIKSIHNPVPVKCVYVTPDYNL